MTLISLADGRNTFCFPTTTQFVQFLTETHGSKQSVRRPAACVVVMMRRISTKECWSP